jgi:hypothetical protein
MFQRKLHELLVIYVFVQNISYCFWFCIVKSSYHSVTIYFHNHTPIGPLVMFIRWIDLPMKTLQQLFTCFVLVLIVSFSSHSLFYSLNLLHINLDTNKILTCFHVIYVFQVLIMGLLLYPYAIFAEPWTLVDVDIIFIIIVLYMWLLTDMIVGLSWLSYDPWTQKHDLYAYILDWEPMMPLWQLLSVRMNTFYDKYVSSNEWDNYPFNTSYDELLVSL